MIQNWHKQQRRKFQRCKKLTTRRSSKNLLFPHFRQTTNEESKTNATVCCQNEDRHVLKGVGNDQTEQAVRMTKMKAHDDAVKKGFPSFLHRWFERPLIGFPPTLLRTQNRSWGLRPQCPNI
eukprot:6491547-Amphidinium_carterae.3